MKSYKYIIAALFVVAIGTAIFIGCEKEITDNKEIKIQKEQYRTKESQGFRIVQVFSKKQKMGEWPEQYCDGISDHGCWLWFNNNPGVPSITDVYWGEAERIDPIGNEFATLRLFFNINQNDSLTLCENILDNNAMIINDDMIEEDPIFLSMMGTTQSSLRIPSGIYNATIINDSIIEIQIPIFEN